MEFVEKSRMFLHQGKIEKLHIAVTVNVLFETALSILTSIVVLQHSKIAHLALLEKPSQFTSMNVRPRPPSFLEF